MERLQRAIKKFNLATKKYEIEPGIGEEATWDEESYVDVDLKPKNFAKMLSINANGQNKDKRYEKFTTTFTDMKKESGSSSTSFNVSLEVSKGPLDAEGSGSKSDDMSFSDTQLENLTLSYELVNIEVSRKWLDNQLFKDKTITSKGDKEGEWSNDRCPYLIEGIIVAKNVEIEGFKLTDNQKSTISSIDVKAKVSFCGLGAISGGYSSSE